MNHKLMNQTPILMDTCPGISGIQQKLTWSNWFNQFIRFSLFGALFRQFQRFKLPFLLHAVLV